MSDEEALASVDAMSPALQQQVLNAFSSEDFNEGIEKSMAARTAAHQVDFSQGLPPEAREPRQRAAPAAPQPSGGNQPTPRREEARAFRGIGRGFLR